MADSRASEKRAASLQGAELFRAKGVVTPGDKGPKGSPAAKFELLKRSAEKEIEEILERKKDNQSPLPTAKGKDVVRGRTADLVLARAVEVFGDESKAAHWLEAPLGVLDNFSPAQALRRKGGRERVEAILTRIEHNIPS